MAVPAIRKVQDAMLALGVAAMPEMNFFIDRVDAEPLTETELPGAVIRCVDARVGPSEYQAQTYWQTVFEIDFQSGNETGETIDLINQTAIADFVAAMQADRSLGGRLQIFEETAISGSEMDGADVGCAILEIDVSFYSPRGDFTTIIGHGGATF